MPNVVLGVRMYSVHPTTRICVEEARKSISVSNWRNREGL